jgi:hypothetical protein
MNLKKIQSHDYDFEFIFLLFSYFLLYFHSKKGKTRHKCIILIKKYFRTKRKSKNVLHVSQSHEVTFP